MKKQKHFTLLELGADAESPMIGTILHVNDELQDEFRPRLVEALHEHFDVKNVKVWTLPDLFDGSPYHDVTVQIDGNDYEIRIIETWTY